MQRRPWSRDELLVAFNLYCKLPFGQLHHGNPRIIEVAQFLDRSANAVAMKLSNLASFDPQLEKRNIRGLSHASKRDKEIFEEFYLNPESLANASESAMEQLTSDDNEVSTRSLTSEGPTETERVVRVRRVQRFFRESVLANYEYKCGLTGIAITGLINASHIIPWSQNIARRADPTNGIALCVLYDRMFDRGMLTFDETLRVVLSDKICQKPHSKMHRSLLVDIKGRRLTIAKRASPDKDALAYHRESVFQG